MCNMNQKLCSAIIDMLDKEGVPFDAIYQRIKTFRRSDEYYNYNQIYQDFEIIQSSDEDEDFNNKINQNVIILAPIFLDNEDIKDKD